MISPERFPLVANSAVVSGTWYGPVVTADSTSHVKGAWTSLIAVLGFHAYIAQVTFGEIGVSTADTSMLIDIGYDAAGGTTYTVEIPNLLAFGASTAGRSVMIPVSIPKGSQVAARCQALISSDTAQVGIRLLGGRNRSNPWPHRGAIQDYGTDTATSGGTVMTNAAADTKSAWVQLGADTTRRHSGLVVCTAPGDSSVAGGRYNVDIGVDASGGTSPSVVIGDIWTLLQSNETSFNVPAISFLQAIDVPVGSSIFARAAAQTTNTNADLEVAVYAF